MNSMLRRCAVVAGVIISGTALAGTYVKDNFDGAANGTVLSGRVQWVATDPSVMITNIGSRAYSTNNAALIPILQNLTNNVSLADSMNVVWSDFWTIPRPFQSSTDTAPTVDTNATAQIFITNGTWIAISRNGSGQLVTNVVTTVGGPYGSAPVVSNDGSNWCHVSVCHDYENKTWSLFIGGVPVATNLGFIDNSVSSYQWFAVQNGGGDSSNKTFLDDVLITNAVPLSLVNDSNSNGLRDAWEFMYYGKLDSGSNASAVLADGWTVGQKSAAGLDPDEPMVTIPPAVYALGSTNAAIASLGRTNPVESTVTLTIATEADRTNLVLGSASPNGPWTPIGSFYTGAGGTNRYSDTNGMNRGNFYFYKVAGQVGSLIGTNETASVFYKYPISGAAAATSTYLIGIPIDYKGQNTLDSTLGEQLAVGLKGGTFAGDSSRLKVFPSGIEYWLQEDGTWMKGGNAAMDAIPLGQGVMITRLAGASPDGATALLISGQANTNPATLTLSNGWNLISWPVDNTVRVWSTTASTGGGAGSDVSSLADHAWLYNGGFKHLRLWADGTWHFEPNFKTEGQLMPSNTTWGAKNAGNAFFYYNQGVPRIWTP